MEYSNGTGAFPNTTVCGAAQGPKIGGFWLNSGQTWDTKAIGSDGENFNGAITAVLENNTVWAARNEINLLDSSIAWYDVDYQYGISGSTCGPANDSSRLSGERDPLGTANRAWGTLNQTTKNQLLAFPKYLREGENGSLTYINMDLAAWPYLPPGVAPGSDTPLNPETLAVLTFFQLTAGFNAYMSPGSVEGMDWPDNTIQKDLVGNADRQTRNVSADHFFITSY